MKKKTWLITLIFIIVVLTVFATVSLSSQEVTLSFLPNPKIDIVLAKSKTNTNVTNFKTDMLANLKQQGIDTSLVNITSVETQDVNIASGFNWNKDVSSSIGSITISSNGKNVTMEGNETNAGKNAIWIIPNENQEQTFDFSYNIDYGDSFNAAGMLLRVKQSGNILTGYMLSFNNSSWYSVAGNNYGAIWKFSYTIGSNSQNMTKQLKQGINISKSGTLHVEVSDNSIKISGGGLSSTVDFKISSSYGTGYGFFSDHYSHCCSSIGRFTLTNISLKTTIVKNFIEVLREPEWRDNAIKVLVNVSDVVNAELNRAESQGELHTRLINENIHFVAWGNSSNQTQFKNLIHTNNENGTFINNTNYSNSINLTGTYIKSLVEKLKKQDSYFLIDEDLKILSSPSDILNNTADTNYPQGKWKIGHDFLYYENNIGQFAKSNKYISDMVQQFDKTGKYTITYEDKTIMPQEIYMHRRPVAVIKDTRSGNSIVLSSNSYDLDSYSLNNKGIQEEEWKYKKTTDVNWTTGKLTSLTSDTDYVVQLRVKDYQNVWSYPTAIYATSRTSALPIAMFTIKNSKITKFEDLEIIDTSYDPYGGTITTRKWEVYKDGNKIYTGSTPRLHYDELGTYIMKLTVTNNRGLTSETYSRKFEIIEDTIAPEVVIVPEECDWNQNIEVNLKFTDYGKSGFKSYQYAITDSLATPTSWSNEITKSSDTITITKEGINYLHIIAKDNAGNVSEDRVAGKYKIDNSKPIINVIGDTNTIQNGSLTMKISSVDRLSGLKVFKINGQDITNGNITFIKNGTYTIYAEDNVGISTTEVLNIQNIYYTCNAGLNHPMYSSNYDSCPICESFKGLSVINEANIYDSQEHHVQYDNPSNANIVEYYNNTKNIPKKVGTYGYELKVFYEGNEYETGIKGKYHITPKDITITDIVAPNKIYNGTRNIAVIGGRLVGVYEGDDVTFKLPYLISVESKDVGNYEVNVDNVILKGTDAYNYNLIQPEKGSITTSIIKRKIFCEGITGKTKKYDKSKVMEITGGTIIDSVENDNIYLNIPKKGIAESENTGEWKIEMDEVTLGGKDAHNYDFIQQKEVKGIIEKTEGILKIGCDSKKFDRLLIEPYITEKNSTADVMYKFYKVGDQTQIEAPSDIGEYEVIGIMESDGNYTEMETERIKVNITKPDEPLMKIDSEIKQINDSDINNAEIQDVHYKDKVKIKAKIQNVGVGSGYVSKIVATLPEGITLAKDSEINQQYGWVTTKDNKIETNKYSMENSFDSELQGVTNIEKDNTDSNEITKMRKVAVEQEKTEENDLQAREIELEVQVDYHIKEDKQFLICFEIEQQDKHGDLIQYKEQDIKNCTSQVTMNFRYFDASVEKKITQYTIKDTRTNEIQKFTVEQEKGKVIKQELRGKKVNNSIVILEYDIILHNEGNEEGVVEKLCDVLPKGVTFDTKDNPNWVIDNSGNTVYKEKIKLEPKESKTIKFILEWNLKNNNAGLKKNQVYIEANQDLDQILILEGKLQLQKTDNMDKSEIIISVSTGSIYIIYITIVIAVTGIIGVGIYFIKRYVILEEK